MRKVWSVTITPPSDGSNSQHGGGGSDAGGGTGGRLSLSLSLSLSFSLSLSLSLSVGGGEDRAECRLALARMLNATISDHVKLFRRPALCACIHGV